MRTQHETPWYVRVGRLLSWSGLVLWLGALIAFGYAVAPLHFTLLKEIGTSAQVIDGQPGSYGPRTVAGYLTGAVLERIRTLEFWGAAALAVGTALLWLGRRHRPRWLLARSLFVGLMVGTFAVYAGAIAPQMEALRRELRSFDLPAEQDKRPARAQFERLHRWYSRLAGATLVLGISLLGLSGLDTHARASRRAS
ncbi:MAG: primosomal replication protein [Bacteroidetes bacterium]|nr:primosomal replication protein [Bacteroidota bacterium]MCX7907079.1 primosomal replication protein [Bacteroidota bacterium]MDW8137557.1 hypothetical protein [Bacteroidota bacterium]